MFSTEIGSDKKCLGTESTKDIPNLTNSHQNEITCMNESAELKLPLVCWVAFFSENPHELCELCDRPR